MKKERKKNLRRLFLSPVGQMIISKLNFREQKKMVCCCVCTTFSFFIWFITASDHFFLFRRRRCRRRRWLFSEIPSENTHTHSFALGYWVDKNNNFIAANRREKESVKKNGTDTYMHVLVCATLITTNTKSNEQWIRILYERVEGREKEKMSMFAHGESIIVVKIGNASKPSCCRMWKHVNFDVLSNNAAGYILFKWQFSREQRTKWKTITFWPLLFRSILFSSSIFFSSVFLFLFLVTPN